MATAGSWIEVKPVIELKRPPEAYRNESDPRGPIFISNCNKFIHDIHEERLGSEEDVRNLEELFTQIGYKSTVVRDLTKQQLFDELINFRKDSVHPGVDSLVAVFMSHGHDNVFVASDSEEIHVDEVSDIFNNLNCPNLAGKPKLLIFQFCRSKRQNNGNSIQSNVDSAAMGIGSLGYHSGSKLSDTHICFCTLPGDVAFRDTEKGSLFIKNLCHILMNWAKDVNVDELMLKINLKLHMEPLQQLCELRKLGCLRKFYFNPKGKYRAIFTAVTPLGINMSGDEVMYCQAYDPSLKGMVVLMNSLSGCNEDVLKISAVFKELEYEVVFLRNIKSISFLKESLSQFKSDFKAQLIVIFFGYGFDDYLYLGLSDKECLSFKVFCEMFNSVRHDRDTLVMFTNTIFKAPASHTIIHHELKKPVRDTFHFCTKVNGVCRKGSLLTKALLQEINRSLIRDFSSFAHNIESIIEESEAENDDRYYTDIRFYGVTRNVFFPGPL